MTLEGNLNEYPLRELLTILASKRETGRLELNLESATGNLYLANGRLVDARVGSLQGLSAVNVIVAADEASFTFHELARPPKPAFNENEQALLSRLIGLVGEESEGLLTSLRETRPVLSPVERRPLFASLTENSDALSSTVEPESEVTPALTQTPVVSQPGRPAAKDVALSFALSAAKQTLLYVQRHNLAFAFVFVLFVVPAIIALTVRLGVNNKGAELHSVVQGAVPSANDATAPTISTSTNPKVAVESPKTARETPAVEAKKSASNDRDKSATEKQKLIDKQKQKAAVKSAPVAPKKEERVAKKEETKSDPEKPESQTYSIVVAAKIENGRVTEASVTNHKAGLDAYEATAIRLAQQRRFPKDKTGTERIVLTVSK